MQLLLFLFVIYLPFYLVLLIYLGRKKMGVGGTKKIEEVSNLSMLPSPWGSIYNFATIIYGLFGLGLSIAFLLIEEPGVFMGIATVSLGTILTGLFPLEKRRALHAVSVLEVYAGVVAVCIFFLNSTHLHAFFPRYLISLTGLILGLALALPLVYILRRRVYPFLEWMLVVGTVGWNFIITIFVVFGTILAEK